MTLPRIVIVILCALVGGLLLNSSRQNAEIARLQAEYQLCQVNSTACQIALDRQSAKIAADALEIERLAKLVPEKEIVVKEVIVEKIVQAPSDEALTMEYLHESIEDAYNRLNAMQSDSMCK